MDSPQTVPWPLYPGIHAQDSPGQISILLLLSLPIVVLTHCCPSLLSLPSFVLPLPSFVLPLPLTVPVLNSWIGHPSLIFQSPLGSVGYPGRPTSCPPSPDLEFCSMANQPLLPAIPQMDAGAQTCPGLVFPWPSAPRFEPCRDGKANW